MGWPNRLFALKPEPFPSKKLFEFAAGANLAIRNTSDVSEQCSGWWSRGESNP
jgi:hypothetical protein